MLDDRFAHLFVGGRQTQEVHFDPPLGGLVTDAHVARVRNAWLVSIARPVRAEPDRRGKVTIHLVRDTLTPRLAPTVLGTVDNMTAQHPPSGGRIGDHPYYRLYRRTWDASGNHMAVLSYRRFAVCAGPVGGASGWSAWPVAATPRRVDAAERERVLRERFGRASGPVPMMPGVRIEQLYQGTWPDVAPFHHDLTAVDDTTYAALRLDPDGGVAADLFTVASGYRGSVPIPTGRGVLGGYGGGLLLLDGSEGNIEFYRISR